MKTNFLKISLLALIVSAFTITSCKDDDDTAPRTIKNQIVGTWEFTSFKVDGDEYMGNLVDTSVVTFEKYTGTQGDFEQTILYSDGERDEIAGKYSVDETKKEVKMTAGGETEIVKVNFPTTDKMDWSTTQDDLPVVAKTERQ
jgi:hypothetical protein